ncbi:MAG: hypothetical protein LBV02_06500 [Bacteroidales bacterium]|jgi:protein-disulfide isomerase|nr:hypothetical protein [Bacteroidales bacterium]
MKKLTQKELEQLIGGVSSGSNDDVINKNTTDGCRCYFNNTPSAVINTNSVDKCYCHCKVFVSSYLKESLI